MAIVNINTGTSVAINTQTLGTAEAQVIRMDMGSGTVAAPFTGTLGAVTNLAGGTITSITNIVSGTLANSGTTTGVGVVTSVTNLANGTFSRGTVLDIGYRHPNEWATVVSTGTSTMGTVKGSVSGSAIYVTHMEISVGSASNVVIGNGGTSLPIAGTFYFNANGGAVLSPLNPPIRTTAGSALVFKQSAAISELTITAGGYVE